MMKLEEIAPLAYPLRQIPMGLNEVLPKMGAKFSAM